MFKTILKFGIVGVLNTIIDYTVFQIIVGIVHSHNPTFLFFASFISGSVGVANSYIFNKKWTFQDDSTDYLRQIIKFVGINLISVSLNSGLVVLFSSIFPQHIMILNHTFSNVIYTKALAIIIVMVLNFIAYKLWVFETKREEIIKENLAQE